MNYHQQLEAFQTHLQNHGKSKATVSAYSRDVKQFTEYLAQHRIPLEKVEANTLQHYQKDHSQIRTNSMRRAIISIRLFFRYLATTHKIQHTPFEEVSIPNRNEALPTQVRVQEVQKILLQPDTKTLKGLRDKALLTILAHEGLKVTEMIELKWEDFLYENASLRIQHQRPRVIKCHRETSENLQQYFNSSQIQSDWIFRSIKGDLQGKNKMSRHGIKFILYEIGQHSGVPHLNGEMLRHYATTSLLERGFSAEDIKHHLGLQQIGNIAKHIRKRHVDGIKLDEPSLVSSENSSEL